MSGISQIVSTSLRKSRSIAKVAVEKGQGFSSGIKSGYQCGKRVGQIKNSTIKTIQAEAVGIGRKGIVPYLPEICASLFSFIPFFGTTAIGYGAGKSLQKLLTRTRIKK